MATIPDVKIRLLVENGQFKAAIGDSTRALAGLGKGVTGPVNEATAAVSALENQLHGLNSGIDTIKNLGAAFLTFSALKGLVSSLTDVNIQFQQLHFTLLAATGTAEGAKSEMDYLLNTVQRLGVGLDTVSHVYGTYAVAAKHAGLSIKETHTLFTGLSEAVTVFHASSQQVQSAMLAIDQSMGQGVFRSQELRQQLGSAIPGVFEAFQNRVMKRLDIDRQEFNKMMSKSQLDVKEFSADLAGAFQDLITPESLAESSQGLNAELNRLKNNILLFKADLADSSFAEALASGAVSATNAIINLKSALSGKDGQEGTGGKLVLFTIAAAGFATLAKSANLAVTKITGISKQIAATVIATRDAAANQAASSAAMADALAAEYAARARNLEIAGLEIAVERDKLALRLESLASAAAAAAEEVRLAEIYATQSGDTTVLAAATTRLNAVRNEQALLQGKLLALSTQETEVKAAATAAANLQSIAETELTTALTAKAAAEGRAVTAEEAETIAANLAAAAIVKETAAAEANTVAMTFMGRATVVATTAMAGLRAVGSGVLALMGGLPGVVIAVGAALAYLALKATDAENQLRAMRGELISLDREFKAAAGKVIAVRGAQGELAKALRDKASPEVLAQKRAQLEAAQAALVAASADSEKRQTGATLNRLVQQEKLNQLLAEQAHLQERVANGAILSEKKVNGIKIPAREELVNKNREVKEAIQGVAAAQAAVNREESFQNNALVKGADARDKRVAALAAAYKITGEAAEAAEKLRSEAAEKALTVDQKVERLQKQRLAAYEKAAAAAKIDTETQAKQKAQLLKDTEAEVRLSEKKTKGAAGDKSAEAAARKAEAEAMKAAAAAQKDLNREEEASALGIKRLDEITLQNNNDQREANSIRDRAENSLRSIADAVAETEKAINDSKIADEEKTKDLDALHAAADRARASVEALRLAEIARTTRQSNEQTADVLFDAANQHGLDSTNPAVREQAARDAERHKFENSVRELDRSAVGADKSSQDYIDQFNNLVLQYEAGLDKIKTAAEQTGDAIEAGLNSAFSNAITGILTGAVSLRQGLATMFMDIYKVFLQEMVTKPLAASAARWAKELLFSKAATAASVADQVAGVAAASAAHIAADDEKLVSTATVTGAKAAESQASTPIIGPILAVAAMVAMIALIMGLRHKGKGHAEGGLITGPGTGTSDSIDARLSNGEFVIKEKAVKKYGAEYFHRLNNMTMSPMGHMNYDRPGKAFADGGLVGRTLVSNPTPGIKEGDRVGPGVRVINIMDPRLLEDYVNSPQGEKTILNVIERNPRKVKQSLGGTS